MKKYLFLGARWAFLFFVFRNHFGLRDRLHNHVLKSNIPGMLPEDLERHWRWMGGNPAALYRVITGNRSIYHA